ncbi:MAG: hypothetical protein KGH87_00680 [Thaumarchaeota archaeon]|nr:hypothetical protein [Nitrososphaerota archaeon]MDE1838411.1 hypothetical protein [Nitrososphaerota archaeon]
MKIIYLAMIMTLSLSVTLLVTTQHAFADTCSAKLTSYNAPQFYLLSDEVFAGTVQHIDNTTNHQWKVYFTVDKIWRGTVGQKPLIVMTNDLQGCGYSIVQGEKYLVYTNGYPPFFNTVWSKPYADAQGDIAIIDDPKFQSDEKAQEELNKKLVIARDAISNLMGSKMGTIPFNSVGVDVINSTLDIGIDSAKAVLSEEAYEKKIKDIVGDIPIKITFGQIVADAPILDTLAAKNSVSISLSPLQQFKSGVSPLNVKCSTNYSLIIKKEDGSPACVKLDVAYMLIKREWAVSESAYPGGDSQFALDTNSTIMPAHLPRSSGLRIPYYEPSRVINYSGFDGVYNETFQFRGTQNDYVLKPGSTGIIIFKLEAVSTEQQGQDYPISLPKSLNLTNYAVFYHEITSLEDLSKYPGVTFDDGSYGHFRACSTGPAGEGMCIGGPFGGNNPIEAFVTDHPGIDILFEPPSEVLPLGMNATSQVVTMTITVDSDAPRGTYLIILPSIGVDSFLLTVGDQPYHE